MSRSGQALRPVRFVIRPDKADFFFSAGIDVGEETR